MANWQTTETAVLQFSAVDNFQTFAGCQQIYLSSDNDCYIDFDQPAVTSRSLLLKKNNPPVRFNISGANVQQVHAIENYTIIESMSTLPTTGSIIGDASWNAGGYLVLTPAVIFKLGHFQYSGNLPSNFTVKFDAYWSSSGADAIYFYWGYSQNPAGEDDVGTYAGYIIAFDEYSGDPGTLQINFGSAGRLKNDSGTPASSFANGAWHTIKINVAKQTFTLYLDGTSILTYTDPTPRTLPGNLYGWGARTGGVNDEHRIRNLSVYANGNLYICVERN